MDDARDASFVLALERDDIAPVALGDDGILQVLGIAGVGDDAAQVIHQTIARDQAIAAQSSQRGAGAVEQAPLVVQTTGDLFYDGRQRLDFPGHFAEPGVVVLEAR